jgi:hypothetical protein
MSSQPTYITFVALFVDAILKLLMSSMYLKIAHKLNDWENHKTDTKYYDSLVSIMVAAQHTYPQVALPRSCLSVLTPTTH